MKVVLKVVKWAAIGTVAIIAVLLIVVALLNWQANGRLEEQLAEIRAAGEPVTLAELKGADVAADQNAASQLRRVEREVAAVTAELDDVLNSEGPFRDDGRLNEEGAKRIRDSLAAYEDVLPRVEQAVDLPHYVPLHDYTAGQPLVQQSVMDGTGRSRAVARLLALHADLQMLEGKHDEAFQTCLRMMRLAEHVEQEPFSVGYLVALAIRGIALDKTNQVLIGGQVSAESRKKLETALARSDAMSGYVWCLHSERAHGLAHFHETPLGKWPLWFTKNWETEYLDMMANELKMGAAPRYSIEKELREQRTRIGSYGTLVQLVYPALDASREAMDRIRAKARCLYVLNAMQRQHVNDGAMSFTLGALNIPEPFSIDPYNGAPLTIKGTDDGWIVYSLGRNGTDEGGSFEKLDDIGAGPVNRCRLNGEADHDDTTVDSECGERAISG